MNLNLNEQNEANKLSNVWAHNTSNKYIVGDVCIKIYKMFYQTQTHIKLVAEPVYVWVCAHYSLLTYDEFTKIDSFTSDVCIDFLWIYTLAHGSSVAVCRGISFVHLLLCWQANKRWRNGTSHRKITIIITRMAHDLSLFIQIHSIWLRLMWTNILELLHVSGACVSFFSFSANVTVKRMWVLFIIHNTY